MSPLILKKCGGLPLPIETIGGLLSSKTKLTLEWKKVHDSFGEEMKTDHNLESLGRILLLSYNDLPYNLKSCLFCFVSKCFPGGLLDPKNEVGPNLAS